jgi:transcriptional regulator with XRE-family HTH domain
MKVTIPIPEFDPLRPAPEYVALGERIRQARIAKSLGQADFKALIGLHPSIISQIENARRQVKTLELAALAYVLDVPMEWLACGDDVVAVGQPVDLDQTTKEVAIRLMHLPVGARERLVRQFISLLEVEAALAG